MKDVALADAYPTVSVRCLRESLNLAGSRKERFRICVAVQRYDDVRRDRAAHQAGLPLQIPVVQDVTHHKHIGRGKRPVEEIAGMEFQTVTKAMPPDIGFE